MHAVTRLPQKRVIQLGRDAAPFRPAVENLARVENRDPCQRSYATPLSDSNKTSRVPISVDGKTVEFSSILLHDFCQCPSCVHESTNQRLFSAADVPANIQARSIEIDSASDSVKIKWTNDAPGFGEDHTTQVSVAALRELTQTGSLPGFGRDSHETQILWTKEPLENIKDFDYNVYMQDDKQVYELIRQLRTDGLAFVTNVPREVESLATIATRIGPIKLPSMATHGMSASKGGASVFADAYKSAVDLFHSDPEAFEILATLPVNYDYNYPNDNVYSTTKPVIELGTLRVGDKAYTCVQDYVKDWNELSLKNGGSGWNDAVLVDHMLKINWGPPFLAPFSNHQDPMIQGGTHRPPLSALNDKVDAWHEAASKFNALLQRPEYLFERKMDPGDCVLFDNTRTLHSRRAFDTADVGKPRWLRGAYVDKDSYFSRLRPTNAAQKSTNPADISC
ncbi:hypothetical protein LA080_016315 [Diaporthe eres]|nr:hypothetical protein LA080_016315 [Diaporthe eres]